MFIQSVRIKPLSSKGQNAERGRNTWREKGPERSRKFYLLSFFGHFSVKSE